MAYILDHSPRIEETVKISIAMATCNGATYLSEQLDSLVSQTRPPDELIVVDDASTDSTPKLVRAFADNAPFPVLLKTNSAPLGYAQNFARALAACTGDLVFLSDQDDVWFENKVATMIELSRANPGALCLMNDALLTDKHLQPGKVSKMEQIRAAGLPDSAFVMGCCVAIKRPFLDLVLPVPGALTAHDNWLVGIADHLGMIHRAPEVLQYYRRHDTNASGFHVNNTRPITRSTRIIEYLEQLPRRLRSGDALAKEQQLYTLLVDRIQSKQAFCAEHVDAARLNAIEHSLQTYLELLTARQDIRKMPLLKRLLPVIKQWRKGSYGRSGGLPGAIKDLALGPTKDSCAPE